MIQVLEQVQNELRAVWRFRWVALWIAWATCLVGWVTVYFLPDVYEGYVRVYVDTRTPLRPLLTGVAADQDVESQIVMVRQALLGKPNLERVAQQAGLLEVDATPRQRHAVTTGLATRTAIDLEPVVGRDQRTPNTFYRIRYQDHDRDRSIKVVDLMLTAFVEDTFGNKRGSAETAEAFLVKQLTRYRTKLTEVESALAEFKRVNMGMVPGTEGGYFERLEQEQGNVQRVEAALRVASARKAELTRQLSGEAPYIATPGATTGGPGSASGQAAADTASRIQEARARLDELLLRFTERHPDVIATRQTLADLEARQIEEMAAVRRGDARAAANAGAAANPVYQNLRVQLHETNVQIAALRGELNDYQGNVAKLRHALNTAPAVEAEFTRLTRDYEVTQSQYNALLQRLEQARVSEDAQQTGIVDFQVIDPPTASFRPVFPNRPLLLALVLLGGVVAGCAVAWLVGKLRPVFYHGRQLAMMTGLPVIGVIGIASVERRRIEVRRDHLRFAAVSLGLVVASIAVTVSHDAGSRLVQGLIG